MIHNSWNHACLQHVLVGSGPSVLRAGSQKGGSCERHQTALAPLQLPEFPVCSCVCLHVTVCARAAGWHLGLSSPTSSWPGALPEAEGQDFLELQYEVSSSLYLVSSTTALIKTRSCCMLRIM